MYHVCTLSKRSMLPGVLRSEISSIRLMRMCRSSRKSNAWARRHHVVYANSTWLNNEFANFTALQKDPACMKVDDVYMLWPFSFQSESNPLQGHDVSATHGMKRSKLAIFSIINFIFEAKVGDSDTAERKLELDLYSAQRHRRALCMQDGPSVVLNIIKGVK